MQPATITMVLAAAVAHAVWNLAAKYKRGNTLLFVWAYSCASTLLWVPIAVGLMLQIDERHAVAATVSAALHTAYSLTLQAGYDRADLGVVYPIARGTGPVLAMLVLDERLDVVALLGALLVVSGVLAVAANPFRSDSGHPLQGIGGPLQAPPSPPTASGIATRLRLCMWRVSYQPGTLELQSLILTADALRQRRHIPASWVP